VAKASQDTIPAVAPSAVCGGVLPSEAAKDAAILVEPNREFTRALRMLWSFASSMSEA
jgi:hypothetical protein